MADRVVIFGIGRIFCKNIDKLDANSEIVAIVDNNISEERLLESGRKASPVEIIRKLDFDYVVIFNKKNVKEIYQQLVEEFNISAHKIIGWQDYLYFKGRNSEYHSMEVINSLPWIWNRLSCYKVCDYNMSLARAGIRGREYFFEHCFNPNITGCKYFELTGITAQHKNVFSGYGNLYDSVCGQREISDKQFDMALFLDCFFGKTVGELIGLIYGVLKAASYALVTIPYDSPNKFEGWNAEAFRVLGEVTEYCAENERYLIIKSNAARDYSADIRIYVVTHKNFEPLYHLRDNMFRIPIQAGAVSHEFLGYERDDTGENISELNAYINECTAMYWIWKNVRCKYVGIEHYRRCFLANAYEYDTKSLLSKCDIVHYMNIYDFIVARCYNIYPKTVYEEIRDSISEKAYNRYSVLIRAAIERRAPDYLEAYDECMNGYSFYPCNLFITRWEHFDDYCEWLFNIILNVIDQEDLEQYDSYSKRVVGFFAERLLTVWLSKHNFRVKELFFAFRDI